MIRDPYDPFYYSWQRGVEERHFWFRARRRVISAAVRSAAENLPEGFLGLEIGCGTGSVLASMREACPRGRFFGLDVYFEGLTWARRAVGARVAQGDAAASPFGATFSVIGLFDVLEHIPDDESTLRALGPALTDGGRLVLTVPARRSLWSEFDEVAHHVRRYDGIELDEKLRRAGYEIEFRTEFMAPLLPLLWILRRLSDLRLGSRSAKRGIDPDVARERVARELRVPSVLNGLFYRLLSSESRRIEKRRPMPFGSSLLVVARKRASASSPSLGLQS